MIMTFMAVTLRKIVVPTGLTPTSPCRHKCVDGLRSCSAPLGFELGPSGGEAVNGPLYPWLFTSNKDVFVGTFPHSSPFLVVVAVDPEPSEIRY